MKIGIPSSLIAKSSLAQKLALSVAGLSSIAIIGSAGVAAASPTHTMYLPNRATCKTQFKHFGFRNHNSCEGYWDKHAPRHHGGRGGHDQGGQGQQPQSQSSGYGGSNGGVAVIVNGDHNVINIVINYFFGWKH